MATKSYAKQTDPKEADEQVVISDFHGMAPSQDPHDIDPELAAIQINCVALHPGELRARQGVKLVTFTT